MRELMRIANQFEVWACEHVDFNKMDDVWPYLLQDKFGETCMAVLDPESLSEFDDSDCLRIAVRLQIPIKIDSLLPVPVDVSSPNPSTGSKFRNFRILTMRNLIEEGDAMRFTQNDEPFDPDFGRPYFSLYGADEKGTLEHIADRNTYLDAVRLAENLVSGVVFSESPVSRH